MSKGRESTQETGQPGSSNVRLYPCLFWQRNERNLQNRKTGWRQEQEIYYLKRRSKHLIKCLKVDGSLIFTYRIGYVFLNYDNWYVRVGDSGLSPSA